MSKETLQLVSIGIYLAGMLLIGWYAYRRTSNLTDYMLGGRSLGPAVTALSAGAADMSGWLLMGLPGGVYVTGLADAWIAIGLTIGAYLNWLWVAPRLRSYTQVANDSITIPSYLENRFKDHTKMLRIVSGIVILVFFTFYVSSGMVSGAVFFQSSFDTSYHTGLYIVGGVCIAYTLFGGFLAVSYTDFIQGLMMLIALLLVPAIGIFHTGGPAQTFETIRAIDPTLLNLFKGTSFLGIVSAMAWGLGYFGQPHIIVRFMAITTVKEIKSARRIGMFWMIFSLIGTILTALIGLAFFHQHSQYSLKNPEAVFIELGQILFHPLFAGFVLAAILAAIMSTISSQLIVTSSALVEDLYKIVVRKDAKDKELVFPRKNGCFNRFGGCSNSCFQTKQHNFKPCRLCMGWFRCLLRTDYSLKPILEEDDQLGGLFGMIVGAVTVIIWKNIGLGDTLYEIVPGFVFNLVVSIGVSYMTYRKNQAIEDDFQESVRLVKNG